MPNASIPLTAFVPIAVQQLIGDRVEPILRDVKKMLESTRTSNDPGFNLTAVSALCAVIGGLSRVFWRTIKQDSKAFPRAARRSPLSDEPPEAVRDPKRFAVELFKVYRCSLVHSFGLNIKWSKNNLRWESRELSGGQRKVTRQTPLPLSGAQSTELDDLLTSQ